MSCHKALHHIVFLVTEAFQAMDLFEPMDTFDIAETAERM